MPIGIPDTSTTPPFSCRVTPALLGMLRFIQNHINMSHNTDPTIAIRHPTFVDSASGLRFFFRMHLLGHYG